MIDWYLWLKAGHIIAVISWMAALLYLPRLLIYHTPAKPGSDQSETFKIMERRLLKVIATPAMLASWLFGLALLYVSGGYVTGWFWSKFFLLVLLSAFHGFLAVWVKEFKSDQRKREQKFYRFANEFPTLLMILIIILAVVKPF